MLNVIRNTFIFGRIFANLLCQFNGSNIVVAVFNIALLIREFFTTNNGVDDLDDFVVGIVNQVPHEVIERYDLEHIKKATLLVAEAMHVLSQGKEKNK